VVDAEVAGYVGDGTSGVGDHPGAAIEQLIGVFLLSCHGSGVPFFRVEILVSGSPSNPAWLTDLLGRAKERVLLGGAALSAYASACEPPVRPGERDPSTALRPLVRQPLDKPPDRIIFVDDG
jgi:hypothetical protein